ncbi:DoxX family protein [Halovivax gelatinilyticus]|uniref:DoxX family protein n=1 Tax=Halovivax gelatinilyticus TaxID=2961597 RepID=UPI0020CA2D20|nr:DoxX family protein [Halovivax gelatinilyticus]
MATKRPAERTLETEILGQSVRFDYSETWIGYSILSLRLVMAYVFLSAGIEKILDDDWSAAGYINPQTEFGVTQDNPLSGMFAEMAANAGAIDPLVIWGQIAIGLALLFGVLVRFAAFWGAIQMLLFWMAAWQGGLLAGLPVEHGYLIDSSFVYALILFGIGAVGAGRIVGLDAKLEESELVQENNWLKYLLG